MHISTSIIKIDYEIYNKYIENADEDSGPYSERKLCTDENCM